MAHLDEDPSRAQMILFVGFVLAVVFVALALVLNSVIFTENLATRSESTRASHAIAVAEDVEVGVVGVIEYANEHNTSDDSTVEAEIKDGTTNIERFVNQQQLTDGAVVSVTYESYNNATWINQSYEAANFTSGDPKDSWTLVSGQEGVRKFRIHIINTSNFGTTGDGTGENFTVIASESGGPSWEMELYKDGGDPTIKIEDGNGNTRFCNPDSENFWINVSAGTVNDTECRALRFGEGVPDVETIKYEHGDRANGTYRLLVNNQDNLASSKFNTTGDPPTPPILSSAAWNATVHLEYQTRTLTYETTIYARPGEDND